MTLYAKDTTQEQPVEKMCRAKYEGAQNFYALSGHTTLLSLPGVEDPETHIIF